MDTETLRTFVLLSKTKSFSKTAEALFVAQSTVTKRIAELERELSQKLFIRDPKQVSLTPRGMIFLSYAERILELEKASINEMNASTKYTSLLRIGAANSIYECHLLPMIQQYRSQNPTTAIKISIGHSADLYLSLQDGLLEVVFSHLPFHKVGYECFDFHCDELVLVMSFQNKSYQSGITKENLAETDYYMCNFALNEVGQFIRALFPRHYQFPLEIDNSTKLIPYLLDGTGCSFLPLNMVELYIASHQLRIIPLIDFKAPQINSYCIGKTATKEQWKPLVAATQDTSY